MDIAFPKIAFLFSLIMKQLNIPHMLEWALRINVFIKLFIYGTGKILGGQFYLKGQLPDGIANISLSQTSSFDLAWTFFGHSKGYILFIGTSQLIAALLFLIPRTKLVGGLMLIPILLNIIIVDYFYGVALGALFSACFYLGSALFVLYRSKNAIGRAIAKLWVARERSNGKNLIVKMVLIALAFGLIFGFEFLLIDFFGYDDRF